MNKFKAAKGPDYSKPVHFTVDGFELRCQKPVDRTVRGDYYSDDWKEVDCPECLQNKY